MMTEHTPGPWRTENRGGSYPISVVASEGGKLVAPFSGGKTDEETANAHLIAAAPDLKEALEELLSEIGIMDSIAKGAGNPHMFDGLAPELSKAHDALAKASGEPNG